MWPLQRSSTVKQREKGSSLPPLHKSDKDICGRVYGNVTHPICCSLQRPREAHDLDQPAG